MSCPICGPNFVGICIHGSGERLIIDSRVKVMNILQLRKEIENQKKVQRVMVGEKLRHYRDKNKMTQVTLASETGVERTSITNIEAGKNNMTIEQLIMFCEVFKITPNDMLLTAQDA